MESTECPSRETLAALVAGRLSGVELEAADHVDRCEACRARAEGLDPDTDPLLAALLRVPAASALGTEEGVETVLQAASGAAGVNADPEGELVYPSSPCELRGELVA